MSAEKIISGFKSGRKSQWVFLLVTMLLSLVIAAMALASGSAPISMAEVWEALTGRSDNRTSQIVWNIRLPRVLAAFLSGMALAVSGAVMQSILRNPLASPFTLGISGAAAFGAAFAIVFLGAGSSSLLAESANLLSGQAVVIVSAFVWSMAGAAFILFIAQNRGATPETMVLAGIAIGSLFTAGLSALQYIATDMELAAIIYWMFGDLGRAQWRDIWLLMVVITPVLFFFLVMSWNYKAMQAGDEYASSLGVRVSSVRITGMLVASLATAVVVSLYGIIAFIGLVVPHIVRRIIGGDETGLIPASALFGGLFLLFSDTIARTLFSPVIIPVGILTSFIGAPLFLFLLLRGMGKDYWQ